MNRCRRSITAPAQLAFAAALSTFAFAQQATQAPPTGDLPRDLVPIHTAAADSGLDYGIWAAGDRYKVSFDGDMTFVPYLGVDYPVNRPLSWQTSSVTVGGRELLDGAEPVRAHTDYRYEYRFGPVTEAYDVGVDGLEQTFVIHEKPAVVGDLVVRGRLTTDLEARNASGHGALDFVDANGDAILSYGAAFVFDAAGRKAPIETVHENGEVQLVVPAAWLQAATWPVTVDPLLTVTAVGAGFPHYTVDVTRDDDGNDVMVCYCKGASASDQDAYVYIMSDRFTGRTLVFSDVTTSWNTRDAQCATSGAPRKYCVVFSRVFGSFALIRTHLHDSNDIALRTNVVAVTSGTGNYDSRPDVGGAEPGTTFSPTGQNFMIVWQRDQGSASTAASTIWGRRLRANGTFDTEFPIAISVFSVDDHEYPSINQQSVRVGSVVGKTTWMVVYQRYPASGPTWSVQGKLVSDDTNIIEPGYTIGDTQNHRVYPKVAGRRGRYLVTFPLMPFSRVNFKTPSIAGHSLMTQRVDWNTGGTPSVAPEVVVEGPFSNRRMLLGGVAYDSATQSHWALTSGSYRAVGGTGRTIGYRVGFNGAKLESMTLESAPTTSHQGYPGGIIFNDDAGEFVASWTMRSSTLGSATCARITYPSAQTPGVSGSSCSGATIAWSGSQQIGSEFSRVSLSAAAPNQFAWLVAGTSAINTNLAPQGMPGCALLVPNTGAAHVGIWAAISNNSGAASIALPLPEYLSTLGVYFQWFYVQPGANSLDLVSTQRLRVDIVK